MRIAMAQFHQVCFEAAFEGLDVMGPDLLQGPEAVECEVIEAFFRVACSSKSLGRAFGCADVPGSSLAWRTRLRRYGTGGDRSRLKPPMSCGSQSPDARFRRVGSTSRPMRPGAERRPRRTNSGTWGMPGAAARAGVQWGHRAGQERPAVRTG
jgi:hypothetical protein